MESKLIYAYKNGEQIDVLIQEWRANVCTHTIMESKLMYSYNNGEQIDVLIQERRAN